MSSYFSHLSAAVIVFCCGASLAQPPAVVDHPDGPFSATTSAETPTILEVAVENVVAYVSDVSDVTTYATNPNMVPRLAGIPRNFGSQLSIGDIVAVNGQPAKGNVVINSRIINLTTAPANGQGIADIVRPLLSDYAVEIQQADGTLIGNIYASGFGGGTRPPGAPLAVVASNNAVIGGTGAFVGVRGQLGAGANTVANRQASITEDPRNRRNFGGGKFRIYVTLYPMARPEVIFPVHPAGAGETLSILMTGLGPTRPGVNPGTPFPADPPQVVNSPIEVIVNERQAEVLAKVGVPGTTDVYRVDIRVPEMTERGTATMQVNVAFIAAQPIRFAVH